MPQLSKRYGLSVAALKNYRLAGIDIYDPAAVGQAKLDRARNRSAGTRIPSTESVDGEMSEAEAKRRKTVAEAMIKELDLAKAQGHVMDRGETIEAYGSTVAAFRAGLMGLVGELPPLLEGMSAADIQIRLDDHFRELLDSFRRRADEIVNC